MATKPTTTVDMTRFADGGQNLKYLVADGFLFLAVAIDEPTLKNAPKSASGKNVTIGSSRGNIAIPGTPSIKVGLNVYAPASN